MSRHGVQIFDGYRHHNVTEHARDLYFDEVAPGGYEIAEVTIDLPRSAFADLGPEDRLFITDPTTGRRVWEGWVNFPGPLDGRAGRSWQITARGNKTLAYDESKAVGYVDRVLGGFEADEGPSVASGGSATITPDPANGVGEGLLTKFTKGTDLTGGELAAMTYMPAYLAGQEIICFRVTGRSGRNDTGYQASLIWRTAANTTGGLDLFYAGGIVSTAQTVIRAAGAAGAFPTGTTRLTVRLERTDTTDVEVLDESAYTYWIDPVVVGRRVHATGVPIAHTDLAPIVGSEGVYAHEVVADVVGRFLRLTPASLARIHVPDNPITESWLIDQLTFWDGAFAGDILDALTVFEAGYTWMILGSIGDPLAPVGVETVWKPWDLGGPRYELDMDIDRIDLPGPETELCNAIEVRWTDPKGRPRVTPITLDVPELEGTGRVKQADAITLAPGRGSAMNAMRAGQMELDRVNAASYAGTATIDSTSRPHGILDRHTGMQIPHSQMRAGYTATVRQLRGTTFRVTRRRHDDEQNVTQLSLGNPPLTEEQLLARVAPRGRGGGLVSL